MSSKAKTPKMASNNSKDPLLAGSKGIALQRKIMPVQMETDEDHGELGLDETQGSTFYDLDIPARKQQAIDDGIIQAAFKKESPAQRKIMQFAHVQGTSTHTVNGTTLTYNRTAPPKEGYIDFSAPAVGAVPAGWVAPGGVDLSTGVLNGWGITSGNKLVQINKNNRSQHFSIARKLTGQGSPSGGFTWHHTDIPYNMVQVNSNLHSAFGHNGGVHLW